MSLTLLFNQFFDAGAVVVPPPVVQLSGGYGVGGGSAGPGHWPPSTDLTPRRRKVKPRHREIRKIERKLRRGVELVPHELEILSKLAGRAHNAHSDAQELAGSPIAPFPALLARVSVNPTDRGLSQELAEALSQILAKVDGGSRESPSDLTELGGLELTEPEPEPIAIGEGIYPPIGTELDRRIRLIPLPPARVRLVPLPRISPLEIEEEEMLLLALAVA